MTDIKAIKPYQHQVQYYETDQMGIAHHSNYIRWFEEARSYILTEIGMGYEKMEEMGIISPVLSVSAKYRSMTHYYDIVNVALEVTKYNGIKLAIKYTISDSKTCEIKCVGSSEHCFLDKSGKPISLKRNYPEIDAILEKFNEIKEA
ncbi:acyl-CoA thioesterase [Lachnospira multipara]|uniref:acyl-CoA thioesterase n=1 Tax=Lachnospira multipara TaxID=28051 RepID=UPI000405E183|nr:acyl-CoA thioesterase [Lachnospira multipara]